MEITSVLLTPQVLMLSAGIVALLWGLGTIPISKIKTLKDNWIWKKLLPLMPIALGAVGAFLPGVTCGGGDTCQEWGARLLVGVWSGFAAAHGRKIFKRIVVDKLKE